MSLWNQRGPMDDVVITSRVRLARNYPDAPFPDHCNDEQAQIITDRTLEAFKHIEGDLRYQQLRWMDESGRKALVERHLISPDLAKNVEHGAVLMTSDDSLSVMIHEEDHLRIQSLMPGLQLRQAGERCMAVARALEESCAMAFAAMLGYLTCCPTNLGTGMRASVMMRLPAATMTGQVKTLLESVDKMGLTIRGLYGEGSEALGAIYQISNRVTLGLSEEDIITAVQLVVEQLIEAERSIRRQLVDGRKLELQDRVMRSYGIMSQAYRLTTREMMERLSDVWLAVDLGWIPELSQETLLSLLVDAQPASLQQRAGHALNEQQRDIMRAAFVREALAK